MSAAGDDASELFVLVDEHGADRGTATRAACHADPSLVHRSVHVLVVTPDGPLWQLRGPHKDTAPSAWDHSCSGHVSAGESVEQAALRELGEELGLSVEPELLEPLGEVLVPLGYETELTALFRLRHPGPFTLRPPELAGLAVHPAGARPAPLAPSCAQLCARLDAERPGWDEPEP